MILCELVWSQRVHVSYKVPMNDEISSSDTVRGKRPNSEMTRDPRFPNLPADLPALAHLRAILEWSEARGQEKSPKRPYEWPYHYVFTALRLSKSYYMAQQVAQKKLRRTEVNIADFGQVEQVYKDLGPVHGMVFHDWYSKLNLDLFQAVEPAKIRQICTLDVGEAINDIAVRQKINEGIESYKADRLNDRQPKATLVAIPAHGNKKEIMQQLVEHLNKLYASEEIICDIKYPIKISGQKRVIQNSLDVLEKKAQNPFITAKDLLSKNPTGGRRQNIIHTNDRSRMMSHSI